jgi:membrane associated rhomboid family serine protease
LNGRGGNSMGFGPPVTPQVIKNIMIANAVVFIAQTLMYDGMSLDPVATFGAVRPSDVWQRGMFWQPFTYMWLHSTQSLTHVLFNMFSLWMFGSTLATYWGDQRFLRYYLTCGFGAGFLIATMPYLSIILGFPASIDTPTLGASGAVYGILLAFSFTWPERKIMLLFPPIPIKALWLIPLLFVMERLFGPPNVSTIGHLGGVIVGWMYLLNEGQTPGAPTLQSLSHRWKRYQMRQKLRAVKNDEERDRKRWRDENRSDRFH